MPPSTSARPKIPIDAMSLGGDSAIREVVKIRRFEKRLSNRRKQNRDHQKHRGPRKEQEAQKGEKSVESGQNQYWDAEA